MITEVQSEKRTYENGPPWLLNNDYIESFKNNGFVGIHGAPEARYFRKSLNKINGKSTKINNS